MVIRVLNLYPKAWAAPLSLERLVDNVSLFPDGHILLTYYIYLHSLGAHPWAADGLLTHPFPLFLLRPSIYSVYVFVCFFSLNRFGTRCRGTCPWEWTSRLAWGRTSTATSLPGETRQAMTTQ